MVVTTKKAGGTATRKPSKKAATAAEAVSVSREAAPASAEEPAAGEGDLAREQRALLETLPPRKRRAKLRQFLRKRAAETE